ncbi:hypothetical protein [Rugosimonospora acidiphila]|uniref:hypothetical protein n=1 Tax=Rugosimonospora acidiphila TaxID=556531 RepID=UPI0031F14D21
MAESIMERLEHRIGELHVEVRRATVAGDRVTTKALRAELHRTEHSWEEALARLEPRGPAGQAPPGAPGSAGPPLPLREQVCQVLTLLSVPAAPRLIIAVHEAFFVGEIVSTRLSGLRRHEERAFAAAPFSRPYYVCNPLTALLTPARGLLALSTWPMERRIIGELSPRADLLTAAIRVAEQAARSDGGGPAARRLLWRFAANIPGIGEGFVQLAPEIVIRAAREELAIHRGVDRAQRGAAARRARDQLSDVEQLFGAAAPAGER